MLDREDFYAGYVRSALWSTVDDSHPDYDPVTGCGPTLAERFTAADLDPEPGALLREQVLTWADEHAALLADYVAQVGGDCDGLSASECAGHDLWLTSNGHGTGFWDRGLGELGDALADAARAFGERHVYAHDDGRLSVAGA